MRLIPITSRKQWLKEKSTRVSSTEIGLLMGINKYNNSKLELWDNKYNGTVEKPKKSENDMDRGVELEDYIAHKFAKLQDLKIKKVKYLAVCDELKICSSFDYMIEDDPNMIFEIKCFDPFGFRDCFTTNEDNSKLLTAPLDYELQLQHQLLFKDLFYADMARLGVASGYADSNFLSMDREPSEVVQKHIIQLVQDFWKSIRDGKRPEPDYDVDSKYIQSLHLKTDKDSSMESTPEIDKLALEYKNAHKMETEGKSIKVKVKTQIQEKMGKKEKVWGPWGSFTSKYYKEKEILIPATEARTEIQEEKRTWNSTFKKTTKEA